jgi:hypothetical protein
MDMTFQRLFELNPHESSPYWKGQLDEEAAMWETSGERCNTRRTCASYKKHMKMLDLLITLGMPFELLFTIAPKIELEIQLRNEGKLKTQQDSVAFKGMHTKEEWRARDKARQACCGYTQIQQGEKNYICRNTFKCFKRNGGTDKTMAMPLPK